MPAARRSAFVSGELARAEELANSGEAWKAVQALWVARNSASDPEVFPTILEKVDSMAVSAAFDRDRFVEDEVATAASESISSLRSTLERDIELARMSRLRRGLREALGAALQVVFLVLSPLFFAALYAALLVAVVAERLRRLLGRPEPGPSSVLARLDKWLEQQDLP
jgi:hypothetical protein